MILLTMLLLPAIAEEVTLPPKVQGEITASLSVRVADQTPLPGTARVRIRLSVRGPADLAVEGPWLEDALSAWRMPLRASSIRADERGQWDCTLDLVQVKPGVVPLPGVRIQVNSAGSDRKIAWPDLLHEPAPVAAVTEIDPPPPSPWPARLRWAGLVALGLVGVAGVVVGLRRWASRPVPSLPPLAAAFSAIDRIEGTDTEASLLLAELDGVIRAYIETLGVPATRRTGAELRGHLHAMHGEELAAVLARSEELKFAGVGVTNAQVRELASWARNVLQASMGGRAAGESESGSGKWQESEGGVKSANG